MKQARAHDEGFEGFTITEVMVVIAVFAIGIVSLTSLFESIQSSQRNALYLNIATQAARSEIETIRNSQFTTITNGATFTVPNSLPQGSTGTVAVSIPANAPKAKQLDVTVSYPFSLLTKRVTVSAYIDAPGSY